MRQGKVIIEDSNPRNRKMLFLQVLRDRFPGHRFHWKSVDPDPNSGMDLRQQTFALVRNEHIETGIKWTSETGEAYFPIRRSEQESVSKLAVRFTKEVEAEMRRAGASFWGGIWSPSPSVGHSADKN